MDLSKKTILVIDDFVNMRMTLRNMLELLGARQVDQAATGEQALRQLRATRYDIVLSDYNLGEGMDGQQLLEQARREGRVDLATVFIMITAEDSTAMVMSAVESEPDAYLSKPFTKDLLAARLERALRRRAPFEPVARALASGGSEAGLAALKTLTAQADMVRLDALRAQASLAFELGELDEAESACRTALAQRPLAWALTLLGAVAETRGDAAAAEAQYRQAIAVTPHYMEAYDRLAALLLPIGRGDESLELLQEAVRRSPKALTRQRHFARLAQSALRPELAERAWRNAVILSRRTGEERAEDQAGLAMAMADRDQLRQARKLAQTIAKDYRQDPDAPWWELIARMHCLTRSALATEREKVLEMLDSRLLEARPPDELAPLLAVLLARLDEVERVSKLSDPDGPDP